MKKILAILLALTMVLALAVPTFAVEASVTTQLPNYEVVFSHTFDTPLAGGWGWHGSADFESVDMEDFAAAISIPGAAMILEINTDSQWSIGGGIQFAPGGFTWSIQGSSDAVCPENNTHLKFTDGEHYYIYMSAEGFMNYVEANNVDLSELKINGGNGASDLVAIYVVKPTVTYETIWSAGSVETDASLMTTAGSKDSEGFIEALKTEGAVMCLRVTNDKRPDDTSDYDYVNLILTGKWSSESENDLSKWVNVANQGLSMNYDTADSRNGRIYELDVATVLDYWETQNASKNIPENYVDDLKLIVQGNYDYDINYFYIKAPVAEPEQPEQPEEPVVTYDEPVQLGLYIGEWGAQTSVNVTESGTYTLSFDNGTARNFDWIIIKNTAGEKEATAIPEGSTIAITELKIDDVAYKFDGGNDTYQITLGANGAIEMIPYLTPAFGGTDHIDGNPKSGTKFEITLKVVSPVPAPPAPVEITDIVFKSDVDFDPENNPEGFTAYLYSVNGTVVDAADQLDPYSISCNDYSEDVWELYLEWRFNGDLYTGEDGDQNYNIKLITPNQTWNARFARCYGDWYSDGSLNIDVYFEFSEDYLTTDKTSGPIALSGFVVISSEYHAQIGIGGNRIIIVNAHDYNLNGDCIYCGYHTEVEEDVVEIIDPTEPSTEEEEDETVEVTPDEEPEEDENPKTGLALALVPMMIAAAVAVITKK